MSLPWKNIFSVFWTLFLLVLGILIFFRSFFISGGDLIIGDIADGQLIQSIHEHWYQVIMGHETWRDLRIYYPVPNTLGYSDTYLLPGILYSCLRLCGIDMFLAYQVVQMLLAGTGFAGMFFWLNRFRGIAVAFSAWGAFLFIIASPFFIGSRNSHIQLLSFWLIPCLLILLELTLNNLRRPGRALLVHSSLLAGLFGLLTYSTFYAAYFFGLLTLIAFLASVMLFSPRRVLEILLPPRPALRLLIPAGIILALFAALFLWTYLPVRAEFGNRSYREAFHTIPKIWNAFNHSTTNLLWGRANERLWEYPESAAWKQELGLPLLTILFSGVGIWSVLRNNRTKVSRPDALITAWVMLAGFLLTFRVGSYSLWKIAYALTPGGGAIREVPRINLALLIPAVLLICIVLQEAWQGRRLRAWVTCLLAMVLISLEQIQLVENSSISRAERAQLLARAMPVPKDAEAFYAFGKPQWGFHTIVPHDSAMYLAKAWNLPTLNGYSGWIPTGWPLFETEPNTAFLNLFEWARLKGIRDKVYLYDLDSGAWVRGIDFSTTAENFGPGDDLMNLPLEEFDKIAVSGWADGEYWGTRTTEGVSVLQLPAMELPSREHYLRMKLDGTIKPDLPNNKVRIVVNGKEMEELTFSNLNPRQEVVFPVELPSGKPWTVEFQNEGSADGPAPGFVLMSFQLEKE